MNRFFVVECDEIDPDDWGFVEPEWGLFFRLVFPDAESAKRETLEECEVENGWLRSKDCTDDWAPNPKWGGETMSYELSTGELLILRITELSEG